LGDLGDWKHFAFLCNFDVAFESHNNLLSSPETALSDKKIKGQHLIRSNTAQTVGQIRPFVPHVVNSTAPSARQKRFC
ncbi:MAG: hypothetical protein Q4D55_09745, partial [Eubacteriales bacterium]|nr:hypothetical protein [Eubacteriales bacterium]